MNELFLNFIASPLLGLIIVLIFIVLLSVVMWILRKHNRQFITSKMIAMEKRLIEEVRMSVKPHFVELSSDAQSMVELATEVWRMERRFEKLGEDVSENHRRGLESSLQRMKRYLEKNDVETRDYTGQKYNDGMNVDVLLVEKDESVGDPLVKETVEPAILHKGQIIRKAKIIVVGK